jgi:hypothetical protein
MGASDDNIRQTPSVRGRVATALGTPAAGVAVGLRRANEGPVLASVLTAPDGHFELTAPNQGDQPDQGTLEVVVWSTACDGGDPVEPDEIARVRLPRTEPGATATVVVCVDPPEPPGRQQTMDDAAARQRDVRERRSSLISAVQAYLPASAVVPRGATDGPWHVPPGESIETKQRQAAADGWERVVGRYRARPLRLRLTPQVLGELGITGQEPDQVTIPLDRLASAIERRHGSGFRRPPRSSADVEATLAELDQLMSSQETADRGGADDA